METIDIIDGQFTIGRKIYEIQDLFHLLEALGIQLSIQQGTVFLNGIALKERSQITKYECPLTQVCERREFFLKKIEYIQEKVKTGKIKETKIDQDIMLDNIRYNTRTHEKQQGNETIQEPRQQKITVTNNEEERILAEEKLIEETIAQLLSRNRNKILRNTTLKDRNESTQRCPNCKKEIPSNWAYCSFCGKKLTKAII